MRRVARAVLAFWIDFVVGDDPLVTAIVAAGVLATWGLVRAGVAAWWLIPAVVIGATVLGLRRAARK